MIEKVSLFQEFSNRGHIPVELNLLGIEDFLERNCKPYRIRYQIVEKVVFEHYVLDGRRNIEEKIIKIAKSTSVCIVSNLTQLIISVYVLYKSNSDCLPI